MTSHGTPETDRYGGPAHQRPELAGDGQLLLPRTVLIADEFVLGSVVDLPYPAFEGTRDRLLLAESFARLDLADRMDAAAWFREHGLLDLHAWTDGRSAVPDRAWLLSRRSGDTADRWSDIADEQESIRWHLATLARLSERRERMDWDPSFGRVIVIAGGDQLVVGGGASAGALLGPRTLAETPGEGFAPTPEQAALRRATDGWPRVTLLERATPPASRSMEQADDTSAVHGIARDAGTTWEATVELERVLMAPHVERALERQVTIRHEPVELEGRRRTALVVREWREWRSVLAPIYVQLFSGLQRVTRGEVGASVCRECGQPFIVIDARRRLFCNARERYRYTQRRRRRRLAGTPDPSES